MISKKILKILLSAILGIIFFIELCYYVYLLSDDIFIAIYFIIIFYIMYTLIIKFVVVNTENGYENRHFYLELFFKINGHNSILNKNDILENIIFLKQMQFLNFYLLSHPNSNINFSFKNNYPKQKRYLAQLMKEEELSNFYKSNSDKKYSKLFKDLKQQNKKIKKKEFNKIINKYDYNFYEEKMFSLLNGLENLNENKYETITEILILIITYCFPLLSITSNWEKKTELILGCIVSGFLLIILILIFKPLYKKKLEEERKYLKKLLSFFIKHKKQFVSKNIKK